MGLQRVGRNFHFTSLWGKIFLILSFIICKYYTKSRILWYAIYLLLPVKLSSTILTTIDGSCLKQLLCCLPNSDFLTPSFLLYLLVDIIVYTSMNFFSNGHNFCYYHFLFWCSNCSRFSQWEPLDMTLKLPLNKMIQIYIKVHGEHTPYLLFSEVTSKRGWYRCMFLYMYYIHMYLQ